MLRELMPDIHDVLEGNVPASLREKLPITVEHVRRGIRTLLSLSESALSKAIPHSTTRVVANAFIADAIVNSADETMSARVMRTACASAPGSMPDVFTIATAGAILGLFLGFVVCLVMVLGGKAIKKGVRLMRLGRSRRTDRKGDVGKGTRQSSASRGASQPSKSRGASQPLTSKGASQPSTSRGASQPSTSRDATQPSKSSSARKASATRAEPPVVDTPPCRTRSVRKAGRGEPNLGNACGR